MGRNEENISRKPSDVEIIKQNSNYLRGTIAESLNDPITGGMSDADNRLLKFHGSYQQDDRDVRNERARKKLEPSYQFMIRARIAGGIISPEQWLAMDELARKYANGTLRVTTRQTFQLHGVLKRNLKQTIREINEMLLSTIAACGDVNRNVMCNPNPNQSELHGEVYEWSKRISDHLLPQTSAYHEIWLDGEKVADSREEREVEPIYGPVYLPRKFKIGVAVPPSNDIDVFSQDLGFIAIEEDGKLLGFNVAVGGGMGMTYGDEDTYPQLARVIGYCDKEKVVEVAEKVVTVQRDYGDRSIRKYARLKYTIDRGGLDWFKSELEQRLGWELEEARPFHFEHQGDRFGWIRGSDDLWYYTLFIPSGRIKDDDETQMMTGLREIARIHSGDFRMTPNQNLIIGKITDEMRPKIEDLLHNYGIVGDEELSGLKLNSISCVALPTCGLAMAEAERYLPSLIAKIEDILIKHDLYKEEISIRMSGCPNGCSRPFLAEIAFTGKAPGKYNMYLGGSLSGERLNQLYRENIGEAEILEELDLLLGKYAKERLEGERFGEFVIRAGYADEVKDGRSFHRKLERQR